MKRYISVIGGAECDEDTYRIAEEVGRLIAEKGAILVCGGLGGVMEAASKGAKEAGGKVVGILPGKEKSEANPYVTAAIPTDMGHARNTLVVRAGDAVIAIGGGYGTLSEIGLALKMEKPVIGINTWEIGKEGKEDAKIVRAKTTQEAVEIAFKIIQ